MASSREYLDFVCEQLREIDGVTHKKMFGEYLIYVHGKPVLLVCDNTVMIKKLPELSALLQGAPEGCPYDGAKPHYILDIENHELTAQAIAIAERVTPLPKRRPRKAKSS